MGTSNTSSSLEIRHYYYLRDGRDGEVIGVLETTVFLNPDQKHQTRIGMLHLELIKYSEYMTAIAFDIPAFIIHGSEVIVGGTLNCSSISPSLNKSEED